jgi:rod shape-determining protein MreC
MTADGSAFGIVQAHLGGGPNSPERYLLEMRGVPFRSALQPGTMIVSSGYGGVYPEGVPVGTILGEIKTSETWARTYLLRPAVSPPQISSVMIIQPQRTKAGVKNVWTSAAAVDSAARRVASAGDSLARLSAMAEVAARRAALDSAAPAGDTTRRGPTIPAPVAPRSGAPVPGAPVTIPAMPSAAAPRPATTTPRPVAPRPARTTDSTRARPAAPRPDSAARPSSQPDTTHPAAGARP